MKKIILNIGAVATATASIATVVACGEKEVSYQYPTLGEFVNNESAFDANGRTGKLKALAAKFLKAPATDTNPNVEAKDNITNEQIINEIKTTFAGNDKLITYYTNYVNEINDPVKSVYMIHFAVASVEKGIGPLAGLAIADGKDADGKDIDKTKVITEVILGGSMSIQESANAIISKFAGDDKRFNATTVQVAATVDKKTKQLLRGATQFGWPMAAPAMGGDNIVKMVLDSIGYTLADQPTAP